MATTKVIAPVFPTELPPRRSQHVDVDMTSDGETWHEKLTVCESATADGKPKLLVRSYYRNKRTGERKWDEPPSGAADIKHASPEMRQKAEEQLQQLQLTLEMIPDDPAENSTDENKKTKKKGFFRRFRGNNKQRKEVHDSKDLQLQKAIAQSMATQWGPGSSEPLVYYDAGMNNSSNLQDDTEEREQIEMAKAISMSEQEAAVASSDDDDDFELLQRALAESRYESEIMKAAEDTKPNLKAPPPSSEDLDRKMPAVAKFDPYAPN